MSYLTQSKSILDPRNTPQSQVIPGREAEMGANNNGGVSFLVDDWTRLRRFLVLGSEGGTNGLSEERLTAQNADTVLRCLKADGPRTVREIVDVSIDGLAPKQDPAIFSLALATVPEYADETTRQRAFIALPLVCRTGTHLFMFCDFVDGMRGWGQGLMKAVSSWYEEKDRDQLAYQLVKYRKRENWTHRDVLRVSHKTKGSDHSELYDWVFGGPSRPASDLDVDPKHGPATAEGRGTVRTPRAQATSPGHFKMGDVRNEIGPMPDAIVAFERAQRAQNKGEIVAIINQYGSKLPHEAIPTELKGNGEVWFALLEAGMPINAMVRNLVNMTRYGVLAPNSAGERLVREALENDEALRKSRLHPMQVLIALKMYASGGRAIQRGWGYTHNMRPMEPWTPNQQIVAALDAAFYRTFQNVEATRKRFVIGVDVSGSMGSYINGTFLTCAEAAAAMAMVTVATEPYCAVNGFAHQFVDLGFHPRMSLAEATQKAQMSNFGSTNAAVPFQWAQKNGVEADAFVVITDNDTNSGRPHPSQALKQYRREMGLDARLAVIGMTASNFSIADPQDAGMMDFVGFDASTPRLVSDFVAGKI